MPTTPLACFVMRIADWFVHPANDLYVLAGLAFLLALPLWSKARGHWRFGWRRRAFGCAVLAMAPMLVAVALAAAGWSVHGYRWLPEPTTVLRVHAHHPDAGAWVLDVRLPDDSTRTLKTPAAAWRLGAVILHWDLPGLLGKLPSIYRLRSLDARLPSQGAGRAVAPLARFPDAGHADLYRLALQYPRWLAPVTPIVVGGRWVPVRGEARYRVRLQPDGQLRVVHQSPRR